MYQNLSRKYRPQTFQAIVGQESIVTTLKNAIKLEKIAPAYLFCGCRGTGKTTLARLFAKTLNCQHLQDNIEPCNHCPSCLEITQGRSLDVLEIDGASNRGIDDIRQINETVGYSTISSRYKIYIIDEVHMLTKEAFNALLKTLEEPPKNVKFFFATTEPQKVLPTILSRCQRFDLKRLTSEQIVVKLQAIAQDLGTHVEPKALELIAQVAEGGLRDAESIFDQLMCFTTDPVTYASAAHLLGITPRHFYFKLDQAIEHQNLSAAFQLSQELFSTGKELHTFLEGLLEHFRTHLLLHFNIPAPTFLQPDEEAHYRRMNTFFLQDHLIYILDYLTSWLKEIHKTPFKRVTLEMIFLHLIQSPRRISLPSLVRRLEALSSGVTPVYPVSSNHPLPPKSGELSKQQVMAEPITPSFTPEKEPLKELSSEPKPVQAAAKQEKKEPLPPASKAPTSLSHQSRYDTILRFAAVEFEGILKKD